MIIASTPLTATTYVFGEDGGNQDLTGNSLLGSTWPSGNTYIIAGDCYVPYTATLTLQAGVVVSFDYDYDGDADPVNPYPTITVNGTLNCEGVEYNEVWFTNYSGTNSGEFEGIKLDGSYGTNLGRLYADYTIFEYGGYSGGLITMGTDSYAEFYGCWIRFSDNYGINSEDEFESLFLESCALDSNDLECVYISNTCQTVYLERVTAFGNGIYIQAYPRMRFRNIYMENAPGNGISLILTGEEAPDQIELGPPAILNSQVYNCGGHGIVLRPQEYEMIYGDIRNCVSAGNDGSGLFVMDYYPDGENELLRILNSIFWDNRESGITIVSMGEWAGGPDIITIQNCVMGNNDEFGLEVNNMDPPGTFDFGDNINAYKDNDAIFSADVEEPADWLEDDGGFPDQIEFVREAFNANNHPPYDFHINWDSPLEWQRTLINFGDEDEGCGLDIDGSPTDIGLFGGQGVSNFIEEPFGWNPAWDEFDCEFYVQVDDVEEFTEIIVPRSTYRIITQWGTSNNDDFIIEAGTIMDFDADSHFRVNCRVEIIGAPEAPVVMRGLDGAAWTGVTVGGFASSNLKHLKIEDVSSLNEIGLTLDGLDPGLGNNIADLEYVEVTNCFNGIWIFDSPARLIGCVAKDNTGYGLKVDFGGTGVEIDGGEYSNNGGSGMIFDCPDTNPFIGPNWQDFEEFEYGFYCHIRENGEPGIICNAGAHPNLVGTYPDWDGWLDIMDNADAQIYIGNFGSLPVLQYGENNIFTTIEGDFAIDYDGYEDDGIVELEAFEVYWGTDEEEEPDPEELFEGWDDQILYDDWLEETVIWWDGWPDEPDDVDIFEIALRFYRSHNADTVALAIPLFEEVAESNNYGKHSRSASLNCLRGSYKRGGEDISTCRGYLLEFADYCGDRHLARMALSQAIWCLYDLDDIESAIQEAVSRQHDRRFNLRDSLLFAIDEVGLRQLNFNEGNNNDDSKEFSRRLKELSRMLTDAASVTANHIQPSGIGLTILVHPNPFNAVTEISFNLVEESSVKVMVFDIAGRQVANLTDREYPIGDHQLFWDANGISSGEYLVCLESFGLKYYQKAVLIR